MSVSSSGLHHVTAIAGRAQANIEFYVRLLGLRLVKRTVNYEDPRTYHFYFGDALGNPGSIISFFPWPGAGPAVRGRSEPLAVRFRVPPGALPYWRDRLEVHRLEHVTNELQVGDVVAFHDPDGTPLELVEGPEPPAPAAPHPSAGDAGEGGPGIELDTLLTPTRYWTGSSVPAESAIVALDTLTLNTAAAADTAALLSSAIGWRRDPRIAADPARTRLIPADLDPSLATALEIVAEGDDVAGRLGTGSIQHVAFRVADHDTLLAARELLLEAGSKPTAIKNSTYFTSFYFRDPAGAVLELATDGPGFLIDEPADELGLAFKLPAALEPDRQDLRAQLPVTASPEYADRFR